MGIDEIIRNLEESPIYAMSLGSKELFHSNFWAWLMKTDPKFISIFFEGITKCNAIKREEKNRDITIHTNDGSIYIIENKIKSLPYVEQLAKYQIEAGKSFKGGVIAALKEPNFDCNAEYNVTVNKKDYKVKVRKKDVKDGNRNRHFFEIYETQSNTSCDTSCGTPWEFMNYSDIAMGIGGKIEKLTGNDKTVTEMYCETVKNLCQIISEKLNETDPKQAEWNFDDAKVLEKIKFDDVYKKLKLDILKEQILKKLSYSDGQEISDNFIFRVETAYSNKQPSISFKFVYNNPKTDKVTDIYSFGIQIQNGGIRRYAETKVGKMKKFKGKNNGYDGFFEAFADVGWFDKVFENGKTSLSLRFCGNESLSLTTNMSPRTDKNKDKNSTQYNAYTDFVYQYYNISDEEKSDIEALAKEITNNLAYAESICGEVEVIFNKFSEE